MAAKPNATQQQVNWLASYLLASKIVQVTARARNGKRLIVDDGILEEARQLCACDERLFGDFAEESTRQANERAATMPFAQFLEFATWHARWRRGQHYLVHMFLTREERYRIASIWIDPLRKSCACRVRRTLMDRIPKVWIHFDVVRFAKSGATGSPLSYRLLFPGTGMTTRLGDWWLLARGWRRCEQPSLAALGQEMSSQE